MTEKMIIPAILSNDEMVVVNQAKLLDDFATVIQLDVEDGQFVNSTTCRPSVLMNVLQKSQVEIHLMVANPVAWLEECVAVKAKRVYVHAETNITLQDIGLFTARGMEVFLAINPDTPIEAFLPYANVVRGCLFLGVQPGKQGQEFKIEVLDKIFAFREMFTDKVIVVDGGVKHKNAIALIAAGADWLVCGSAIFSADNPVQEYKKLEDLVLSSSFLAV